MTVRDWPEIMAQLVPAASSAGLDLLHPFALSWFNRRVAPVECLDDFERPDALGVLIGNTRALWPPFKRSLEPSSVLPAHPLDGYVERTIETLITILAPLRANAYFAHVIRPRAVPMQRLAEAVGFAALSPVELSVHAQLGPWFALRAVLVVDVQGPAGDAPTPARPCQDCPRPCVAPFQRALSLSPELDGRAVAEHAADWIAVRDACPVGRPFRYGEEQLAYHYGLNRRIRG